MTASAAFLLFLAWLVPAPFQHVEREPNDRPADATPLVKTRSGQPDFLANRFADGVVARGRLVPGDVDHFAFAARAGDVLMVSISERDRGAFADPVLGLAGPGDAAASPLDDDGGPGFLARSNILLDRTGIWTLAVAGFGDDELDGGDHEESFAYDLVVAVAARPPVLAEHDVRGGNDSLRGAQTVPLLPQRVAVIEGRLVPGDADHFLLPLPPHALLTASLYDDEGGAFHDSRLELRDLAGRLLAADDDSGPGFLSNLALDTGRVKGPVVVRVSGFDPFPADAIGHEEDFAYRLVVSARRSW